MPDHYKLLGLTPAADTDAVRAAYRRLAKRWHPDAHPGLSEAERERYKQRFVQLAQAYQTLSDPARRQTYDRVWRATHGASASGGVRPGSTRSTGAGTHRTGPRGSTAGTAGAARGAGTAGAGSRPEDVDVEGLVREVEALLQRFGLDLRQPMEALVDALLDWARALYRQVVEAWEAAEASEAPPGATGRPGPAGQAGERPSPPGSGSGAGKRAHTGSGGRPGTRARQAPLRSGPVPPRSRPAAGVEAELRRLKREVAAGRRSVPTGDEARVEAALRELKRRVRSQREES